MSVLSWYRAACFERFDTIQDISITMDATRLSEPARDLMMYAVFSVKKGVSAWLAPQAFGIYKGKTLIPLSVIFGLPL